MKVFLSIEEVNAAVAAYVPELGISVEGKTIDVDLVTDDGVVAVAVTIEPEIALPKSIRRRRRSAAEMQAAREHTEDVNQPTVEATPAPEEEIIDNPSEEEEVETPDDTEPVKEHKAPEPAASTSLFD